jgi:hypothetical protein
VPESKYQCRYCGFTTANMQRYIRHFGTSLGCRQTQHHEIAELLKAGSSPRIVARELGVDRATVYAVIRQGPPHDNGHGTVRILHDGNDLERALVSLSCDVEVPQRVKQAIDRVRLSVRSSLEEMETLKKELVATRREVNDLRTDMGVVRSAKAKAEEERDRVVRIHNEMLKNNRPRHRGGMTLEMARELIDGDRHRNS